MSEPHWCIRTDSEHERPVLTADMRCYFCGQLLAEPEPVEPGPLEVEVEDLSALDKLKIRRLAYKGFLDED
jgi:hypothetical protein